jgi:hypothetical protein
MKRRTFIKRTGTAGVISFIRPSDVIDFFKQNPLSSFEDNFKNPPASGYPQNMWFWVNGNVSKEGITLDLEAMKRVGISGLFNFDVGTGIPKGPVTYLSKDWIELKKHGHSRSRKIRPGIRDAQLSWMVIKRRSMDYTGTCHATNNLE